MITDDEADAEIATMFDEVQTVEMVNGKPRISDEQTLREMDEKEMENAVADFVRSAREFLQLNTRPDLATDSQRPGILWWRALQWLALADSHLKDCFCGQDRSPQSIQRFHCWKLKMIDGTRYRTDA